MTPLDNRGEPADQNQNQQGSAQAQQNEDAGAFAAQLRQLKGRRFDFELDDWLPVRRRTSGPAKQMRVSERQRQSFCGFSGLERKVRLRHRREHRYRRFVLDCCEAGS